MTIEAQVRQILCEQGIPDDNLPVTGKLVEDFGMDSLDIAELCIAVENRFDVTLDDDEEFSTLLDVVQCVERKQAATK